MAVTGRDADPAAGSPKKDAMSPWLAQRVLPGKRHVQDAAWLAQLRREGVARCLPAVPEPPPALYQGVEEFNRGSYWKAHETLESVWLQTEYALRLWYYALIKLAVGFYHLERRNSRGARSQLRAALNFLEPFQPIFVGVRLEGAVQEARQRLEALQRGAAWETLEALPRPQLTYDPSPDKR